MPNVWTHIIYGKILANKTGCKLDTPEVKAYFHLGCQGPDLFYYHNFWPWIKDKPVYQLGHDLHQQHCGPVLIDMIIYGVKHPDDHFLKAYILGFVAHHLLDRTTHPYIFFRSGNEENKHQRLETIIDTLLLEKYHGLKTWRWPVYKEIYSGQELFPSIINMLDFIIKKHFPQRAKEMPEKYIEKSYLDTIRALKILFDPWGWKHKLFPRLVVPFSHHKVLEITDFLNLEEKTWFHPAFPEENSKLSFIHLLEKAEAEGMEIFNQIENYWENPNDEKLEAIHDSLGNLSYETGKDCNLGVRNYYFDPIL